MLIAFGLVIVFAGSLVYFLGFNVNIKSLLFYCVFLVSTAIFCLVIFLIIDKLNKTYIIFDEEKIVEKSKYNERTIVYYNQILYTQYHDKIDLINCTDFGYVEIVYKIDSKDNDAFEISEYAYPALAWACKNGIINGDGNKLMPLGSAERCQVATMLMRFCKNILGV